MKNNYHRQVAVIVTVLNEESTIVSLLESLRNQSRSASEVIIVDGGSTDTTVDLLKKYRTQHKNFSLQVISKPGNRSFGRNTAIKASKAQWIAITDAGCVPEKHWLKSLLARQRQTGAEVVAGYYRAEPTTPFQAAMIPYALVMPDQVDEDNFLPATRSMLVSKRAWSEVGGFNEKLTVSEDFSFALMLRRLKIPVDFTSSACVVWKPRSNLKEFVKMIYHFAQGDMFAGIVRPKVLIIYFRYLIASWIFLMTISSGSFTMLVTLILGILTYIIWAVEKNFHYAKNGWYWLPILQISSDLAIMAGSVSGIFKGLKNV
jgi:glycosyltransferase involved in cell wall biosynthesis